MKNSKLYHLDPELFTKDYSNLHVADQVFVINNMVRFFLAIDCHNQYYITNITAHLVAYSYDLVKFLDEAEVNVKIGYIYAIKTLKTMKNNLQQHSLVCHLLLIEEFKRHLDIEINKIEKDLV